MNHDVNIEKPLLKTGLSITPGEKRQQTSKHLATACRIKRPPFSDEKHPSMVIPSRLPSSPQQVLPSLLLDLFCTWSFLVSLDSCHSRAPRVLCCCCQAYCFMKSHFVIRPFVGHFLTYWQAFCLGHPPQVCQAYCCLKTRTCRLGNLS